MDSGGGASRRCIWVRELELLLLYRLVPDLTNRGENSDLFGCGTTNVPVRLFSWEGVVCVCVCVVVCNPGSFKGGWKGRDKLARTCNGMILFTCIFLVSCVCVYVCADIGGMRERATMNKQYWHCPDPTWRTSLLGGSFFGLYIIPCLVSFISTY